MTHDELPIVAWQDGKISSSYISDFAKHNHPGAQWTSFYDTPLTLHAPAQAAADERDRLKAEVQELRDDRDSWMAQASARAADAVQFAGERDRLNEALRGWINANAPGGWIDDLRVAVEALRKDAERWRGVKARHGMSMVRLATGSSGYSSAKKDGILDSWADMACAEVDAFDAEAWREEVQERIAELGGDTARASLDDGGMK